MANEKKPPSPKPQPAPAHRPAHDSTDFGESVSKGDRGRAQTVTNTLPAPPNPHQGGGEKDKK